MGSSAPDASGAVDAAPSRSFALASGGVELVVTGSPLGLQITPANLADDNDVIEVHQEFYGIPWDAFEAGTSPPPEWVALMGSIASAARATGKPVFLSLTMLDGGRNELAAKTVVDNGDVKSQDGWSTLCYDFHAAPDAATVQQGYLRYVAWMIDEFSPRWLNVAVEVNLFFEKCPAAVDGLVDVANAAYDAAKAKHADLSCSRRFRSTTSTGTAVTRARARPSEATASMRRTRRSLRSSATASRCRRTRCTASSRRPTTCRSTGSRAARRAAASARSWPRRGGTRHRSSSSRAAPRARRSSPARRPTKPTYLGRVLDAAQTGGIELVNWWSDRDLVVDALMTDCPCTFDATWCAVLDIFRGPATDAGPDTQEQGELGLKAFGVMGLRAYDGNVKPAVYARWMAARATPWTP